MSFRPSRLILPALDVEQAHRPWPLIFAGFVATLVLVVGVSVWVWLAPLSGAVIGAGQVKVDMNRKTVQHQEGGIVGEILVRDGSKVKAGQNLILLKDVRVDASNELVRTQLDAELAKSARLSTEQSGMTSIVFPPELAARSADPRVAQLLKSESALFAVRRDALTAQLSLITR
ncbi:MAG TPA: HlyD family type I secretion periplasmic adaptor subunit, partial [Burkholderiales bacterium]|nr:HlyD family type I secretion periplasmic adaptor subunit [Burkholderiales bacterium]